MQHGSLTGKNPKQVSSSAWVVNPYCQGKPGCKPPQACDVPTFLPGWSVKSLPPAETPPSFVQSLLLHHFIMDLLWHVYKVLMET